MAVSDASFDMYEGTSASSPGFHYELPQGAVATVNALLGALIVVAPIESTKAASFKIEYGCIDCHVIPRSFIDVAGATPAKIIGITFISIMVGWCLMLFICIKCNKL